MAPIIINIEFYITIAFILGGPIYELFPTPCILTTTLITDPPEYVIDSTFTVAEGDPFSPPIILTGNPLPMNNDSDWFLNDRPLTIMPGIDFGADFIRIQMVTRMDGGVYLVNSSNIAGIGSGTFELIVEGK